MTSYLRPEYVVAVEGRPVLWTDCSVKASVALVEHPDAVIYVPREDPELAFHELVDRDPDGYRAWLEGRLRDIADGVEPARTVESWEATWACDYLRLRALHDRQRVGGD